MKFLPPLAILITALACWAGYSRLTVDAPFAPLSPPDQALNTSPPAPASATNPSSQASENPFDLVRPGDREAPQQAGPLAGEASFQSAFLTSAHDADSTEANGELADESVPENGEASHIRMVRVLEKIRDENRYEKAAFGREPLSSREHRLTLKPGLSSSTFADLVSVAEHRLWLGDTRAAIAHLQAAQAILEQSPTLVSPMVTSRLLAKLGLASLRLGENENCVDCNSAASCLMPIQAAGVHQFPEGSEGAIDALTAALAINPMDFTSRWLLNLAAMTLGRYPHGVPSAFRIDPACFTSEASCPQFENVAVDRGVNATSLSGGSVADDFDGDGDLDLVVSSWGAGDSLQFFRNTSGRFQDESAAANFTGLYGGLNLLQADYDNDGDLDLFVLRGAWLGPAGAVPNSLLDNDGTGRFTDVTFRVGLARPAYPTQTAVWLDYDNDGDLDLFVGNENAPSQLFENVAGKRFQDVTRAAGINVNAFVKGVTAGDYDQDGFPDLYISVLAGPNHLLHNDGDGTFTDVAEKLGVAQPINSFPTWFWDANQDGHLDLFVSTYTVSLAGLAETFFGQPTGKPFTRLYEGDGAGGFKDVSTERHLNNQLPPMGANFGDLDNDGFPDFYLGTGAPAYEALMPNKMYLSSRGERFFDITTAGGFGHLQKGHGISFADYDNDGDQDVFAEMGGAYPGDRAVNCLFENPGFGNHWITIQLVGHLSNRSAIGARIAARIREGDRERTVYHWVGSGGSFGCNPLRCEIGLGTASVITQLEVYWPTSKTTQVFSNVDVDQFLRIDEGSDELTPAGGSQRQS
jgi:hypothetical protein